MNVLRAVPLSLLCLTLLAASAAAECAWVLWFSETQWTQIANEAPIGAAAVWSPEESFVRLGDCNATRARRIGQWKQRMESQYTVRVDPDGTHAYAEEVKNAASSARQAPEPGSLAERYTNIRNGIIADARCLPDTVDPRGAKGGQR